MNAPMQACDHRRVNDFLDSSRVGLEDEQLLEHLDTCNSCREYMEMQAADAESWKSVGQLLQPGEFDQSCNDEYSLATMGPKAVDSSAAIQGVLDNLTPTDEPSRLGRLGIYEVSGVVGAGGMGVVLKAVDPGLDRVVAIKVMAPHLSNTGTARRRFSREAKAAAAVLHPNVIPIHSVSSDEKNPYLVMAFIRGGSLQKRLDNEGPLSTVEILRIGSQIAAGLAAAHDQGLVHRDVKPENILLEEGVERITLTDFGLARAVDDSSVTQAGTISGTPRYMSPEQARGEAIDQRSDLFSLGSVLYVLSSGIPPFEAETSYTVMRKIIDEEPTPIRELNPEVPRWLCHIINQLMAKKQSDRFQTAHEVHKLLEACLHYVQKPTQTDPPESLFNELSSRNRQVESPRWFSSKRFLIAAIGVLIMLSLFAMDSLASKLSLQKAREAFTQAQAELNPSKSIANPSNAVSTLLQNENGPGFLLALDAQFKHFSYDRYLALDGESEGAVFIWNREEADSPQVLISMAGKKINLENRLPSQIHVSDLRIENDALLISYIASDRLVDRQTIKTDLNLLPGASYETTLEIRKLFDKSHDWMIPFKEGRLVSQQSPIDKSVEQLILDGQELDTDGEAVILELIRRYREGLLDADQITQVIQLVLRYQGERELPWSVEMGDLIEKSWVSKDLSRDLWEQYTSQFLVDYFDVKVRQRIVIDNLGGVNLQLVPKDVRCGSGEHITFQLQEKSFAVRIGDHLITSNDMAGNLGAITHKGGNRSVGRSFNLGQVVWDTIKPGSQTIAYESELAILESDPTKESEQSEIFASQKVIFETQTTFLPSGQSTVTINTDPKMKADVDRSLAVKQIKTELAANTQAGSKYYVNLQLDVRARPIDVVFKIFLNHGANQYDCGLFGAKAEWSGSSEVVAFLPIDLNGQRVEVVFQPSPEIAERSIDLFEIWGEEIIVKDVMITGQSAADQGMMVLGKMDTLPQYVEVVSDIKSIPNLSLRCSVFDFSELPDDWPTGADPTEFQKCNPFHQPAVKLFYFHEKSLSEDRKTRIRDPEKIKGFLVLIQMQPFKVLQVMEHTGRMGLNRTYCGDPPYANDLSAEFSLDLDQPDGSFTRYQILPTGFQRIDPPSE